MQGVSFGIVGTAAAVIGATITIPPNWASNFNLSGDGISSDYVIDFGPQIRSITGLSDEDLDAVGLTITQVAGFVDLSGNPVTLNSFEKVEKCKLLLHFSAPVAPAVYPGITGSFGQVIAYFNFRR
jgi:hypothetical protein